MNADLQELINDAKSVKSKYYRQRERIEADQNLSPLGKSKDLDSARDSTNTKLTKLGEQFEQTKNDRIRELTNYLFGLGKSSSMSAGDISLREISYRQAMEQAEKTTNLKEMETLFETADLLGDKTLKTCLGFVAVKRSEYALAERIVGTDYEEELAELNSLINVTRTNEEKLFGTVFKLVG